MKCALYLCSTSNIPSELVGPPGSIPCPLCRNGIVSFIKLPTTPAKGLKPNLSLGLCNPCILNPGAVDPPSDIRRNRVAAVSSELVCPLTCSTLFPSVSLHTCTCDDELCDSIEPETESPVQSPRPSQSTTNELDKTEEQEGSDRTSCSSMFWARRSCHREQQCTSEISA